MRRCSPGSRRPARRSGDALAEIARSAEVAALTVETASAELSASFGSGSLPETRARFVRVPAAAGVTTIVTFASAPCRIVPSAHVTGADPLHEPCEVLAETSVTPAGSVSARTTPVAAVGPLSRAVSAYVRRPPTGTGSGEASSASARSARRLVTVIVAVALSTGPQSFLTRTQ